MKRGARLAGWVGIGILAGTVLVLAVITLVTRTEWGMERFRLFGLGWLEQRIEGEVRVGRLTGGGLLRGATLHDVAIIDPFGRPFVRVDSAAVAYNWRTLIGGEIVLEDVVLYGPEVYIEKLPGDTAWNFEYVFPDTTPGQETPGRTLVLFQDARIVDGLATVRMPLDVEQPGDTLSVTWEQMERGLARVMTFRGIEARLDRVIWETPVEPGRLIEIADLSMNGVVWREPLQLESMRGRLVMRDSIISFEVPAFELPDSRGSLIGRVITGGDRLDMDIRVDADAMRFRDLQWVYAEFPQEGGGEGRIRIQSQQPKGTLLLAEDARLFAPGTNLAGTLGVVFGDTLYFTQVDLRASPLNVEFLENLLPGELPVDGLLVGTVEVTGPLSALEIDGDVRLQSGPGAGSSARVRGTFDATRSFATRNVRAELRDFDLAILERMRPGTGLRGRVNGRVEARGTGGGTTEFTADLTHRLPEQPVSRFTGSGTFGRAGAFDLTLNALPASLDELAAYYPALTGLHGNAEGEIHARGTLRDLTLTADLLTSGGPLQVDAALRRSDGVQRYTGYALTSALTLDSLHASAPPATLTGRIDFDFTGASLSTLEGDFALRVDSADIAGMVLAGDMLAPLARADARVEDGLLLLDSARAATEALRLDARGSFGLVEGRSGTIEVAAHGSSLTSLEDQLFDDLPQPGAAPRVAGSLAANATLTGGVSAFDLGVSGNVLDLQYLRERIGSGELELAATRLGTDSARWDVAMRADSLYLLDARLDSLRATLIGTGSALNIAAHGSGPRDALALGALLQRSDSATMLDVDTLVLGVRADTWRLAQQGRATLVDGTLTIDPFRIERVDGAGYVDGGGVLAWGTRNRQPLPLDFSIGAVGVPVSGALELAALGSVENGTLQGNLRLTGTTAAPYLRGGFAIDTLQYRNARLARVDGVVTYRDTLLEIDIDALHANRPALTASGRLPLDLRLMPVAGRTLDVPVDFVMRADSFPLAIALGLVGGFEDVQGYVNGELTASGGTGSTELGGGFRVEGGAATWAPVGVRYRNVAATFDVMQDRVFFVEASARAEEPRSRSGLARTDGGSARVTGRIDFAEPANPELDLRLVASNLLAANRRDVILNASGNTWLRGTYREPVVSGTVTVNGGALYVDEIYRQYMVVGLDSPLLFDVVDTTLVSVRRVLPASQNPFLRNLAVRDTRVTVGPGSWIRSSEMNVEVTGDLTVTFDRRQEDLIITGLLEAQRGTYDLTYPPFQTRRFDVREGTVEFPGTPGLDPTLAITAVYRARSGVGQGEPIDILAQLSGSLQAPRVRLTSDEQPPISESDLASYLFFGVPTYALDIAGDGSGGGLTNLGVGTLAPTVLGSAASLLQNLAQRYGLVDYVGLTAADNLALPHQDRLNPIAGTNLEVGRYWGPLYVAATQQLDGEFQPGFRVEWTLNPTFTAEVFGEDRFARAPGFGGLRAGDFRKVYGFSLFREWSY